MVNLESRVRDIVAEISGLPPDVHCDANLYLDLGVASVHALQLLLELEEQFDIKIPDADFVEATSITKLATLISTLGSEKGQGSVDA